MKLVRTKGYLFGVVKKLVVGVSKAEDMEIIECYESNFPS